MKKIFLSQNKAALVDNENYKRLNQFKWYACCIKWNWYARRNISTDGKQKSIKMHREIMDAPKYLYVDHINGNTLDNRKNNLRLCTNQQNMQNRRFPQKNNKLGIKGVSWCENIKKFRATINIGKKQIHLGYFNILSDADSAYRIAEIKYFGEFARKLI